MLTAIEAGVNAPGCSGCVFETVARVSDDRCENLRATCHRSRVWHNRFPDAARSQHLARNCSCAFCPMNNTAVGGIVDPGRRHRVRPGLPILARTTWVSIAFLGIWRAFAVVFFSLCALVENAI